MEINGNTRIVVHLAYPSAHLQTPQLFNVRCRELGLNAVQVPWQVHADHLPQVLAALRVSESVSGMIVTIPHKESIAALCDRLEGPAALLKVANVVRKTQDGLLVGRILDGEGFIGGLRRQGRDPRRKKVLLVGAGGVAVAIAYALLDAGVHRLRIVNRTLARAQHLVERLQTLFPGQDVAVGSADASGYELVINATALGMHAGDPLPLDVATIAPATVVAEVVMLPALTPLLQAARDRGADIHAGRHMLLGQIDPFIDFILGSVGTSS